MKYFWLWIAMTRSLKHVVVFHENVPAFGQDLLEEGLGDMYFLIRTCDNAADLGWASRRVRQIVVLILKQFATPVLL
eukprot:8744838-Pyramimonas_sp.AAC.1